mmetsp:Transcript_28943/g.94240  ORF Transcript_28943/g.94240 Transcript_28943/m.94240 type:complete len:318 (-) Transcript_28943:5859-6812(-)
MKLSKKQSWSPHAVVCCSSGQGMPPLRGACLTVRSRVRLQVLMSHLDHGPKSVTMQLVTQGWVLQARDLAGPGHPLPPYCGKTSTSGTRSWCPLPQVEVQAVQWKVSLLMQSMGHMGSPEQVRSTSSRGQGAPPWSGCRVTVRSRFCSGAPFHSCPNSGPEPMHFFSHWPHAPQSDTAQSTGHGCVLHTSLSTSGGHGVPPCSAGRITLRSRLYSPGPECSWPIASPLPLHLREQSLHADQSDTLQCTGQGKSLHLRCSHTSPHGLPPFSAGCTMERCRSSKPPPRHSWPYHSPRPMQAREQLVHGAQSVARQSTTV